MTPEQIARVNIDKMLLDAGYVIQDMSELNRTAALGVAVREYPTNSGEVDYLIFIEGEPAGVIEAKAEEKGFALSVVAEQSARYMASGLKHYAKMPDIRFAYESTGTVTNFRDAHDEKSRSRKVFSFHLPETLQEWLKENDTLRNRLRAFPAFDTKNFRKCQVTAIENLEASFSDNKPRALIQMATGAGKTFTAITAVYRLLKFTKAKRVLFLVDTKNLGEQAEQEFLNYLPNDDGRLFSELYSVKRLNSSYIPGDTRVCISTIQRMYSILRSEEMGEDAERDNPNERKEIGKPHDVAFNPKYPPEFFDFIIIDECHRSIYNIWQQVLDYFDAFLIGLTATPDSRTFGFFNKNIVSEYTHEQAVLDNVNVGRDGTYLIETEVSGKGGKILKQVIEKRERMSRKRRWEQLDEDIDYVPAQLDRDIVNPSQIRTVIQAFASSWRTIFPNRDELPKTLVFAKTDSHADDIITIIREEFGEGNDFCKKVTYGAEDPKSTLTSFRNDYYPRIAVTVDMIATGTDVKPIECLVFMRNVRSKNYFEQMLGRATRTLGEDDLKKVSPSAKERKLGYIVVDAVGVTKSQKTTSRQLERKPTASLKDLMIGVALGATDEDTLTTLAGRLAKLDKVMTPKEKEKFKELCQSEGIALGTTIDGNIPLPCDSADISAVSIAKTLLNAFDADIIAYVTARKYGTDTPTEKEDEYAAEVKAKLASAATAPFNNQKLRDYIENVRKSHDQIIDTQNIDTLAFSGWDDDREAKADETIATFARFIEDNKNTIDALSIIYTESYKSRPLTLKMIKELHDALRQPPYVLLVEKLWFAYGVKQPDKVKTTNIVSQLADIVSLIRFQLGQSTELASFSADVKRRFQVWTFDKQKGSFKFTQEQAEWLRLIRDHIAASIEITADDLELSPFDNMGGLGKFYQLFEDYDGGYEYVLKEMNYALIAA
ncbi:MAG: DEAD/DEAH box helicase family protein [Deltaproteobacteria bacterium]|jgi:type I restriction enzyme R subunit|nr:DEAD/DEAH box helicase family protein [Deltaproteobacteria bacterium]